MVDPSSTIFRMKIPSFALFVAALAITYKPNFRYLWIIVCLVMVHILSYLLGSIRGVEMDGQIQKQYFFFFVLLCTLFWSAHIDLSFAVSASCFIVSVASIVGFIVMKVNPVIEEVLYQFMNSHDQPYFMAHRHFLGVEFTSFLFKTLPVTLIPAAYHYEQFLSDSKDRRRNLFLVLVYLTAMFCGGQRTMFLGIFAILVFITYPRIKHYKVVHFLTVLAILVGFYIAFLAITDPNSESTGIKFGHLESYRGLLKDHWGYLFFGMGPGAMFYSKGVDGMIPLAEWTYFEIIRMYGLVGLVFFIILLVAPLVSHNDKKCPIKSWRAIALGYVFFLISCMSNPYLIGSTGLICILFIYSTVDNKHFRINRLLQ